MLPKALIPVLLLSVILAGCCTCKESQVFPKPYSIELSSGGGVSGLYTGFFLSSNGTISYWRGWRGQKEFSTNAGEISESDLLKCKKMIDDAKLSSLSIHEAGNMTTTLRVTEGDELFTLSWAGADSDEGNVPAQVRPVYSFLQNILEPLRQRILEFKPGQE